MKNITPRTPAEQEAINALHGIARSFCKPTQLTSAGVEAIKEHVGGMDQAVRSVPRSMQEHALRAAIRLALDRLQDIAADEGVDSPETINYLLKTLDGGR